ncbi:tyrosine-type recombinase/integrase [Herbiconiux daphne]|uniref:Site-specific integrase n=1 Tax=Herbiconiux daphne TaxID=2970914 RepID=A0ABT2H001_9MICO|nr:site-specific integrase [Herbiconiux daphne]MCS5732374.1 site-specific integrase [Herbiconiux daphne]
MSSIQKRPNGVWRARYRDHDGKEHSRHFRYKDNPRDLENSAQHWLNTVTAALVAGTHVDPRDSRQTLASFYDDWSPRQIWAASTVPAMNTAMNGCTFRTVEFRKLRRSHGEAWVKSMQTAGLQPSTIRTRVSNVRTVLRAAIRDRALTFDPLDGVVLPRLRRAAVAMEIPTPAQVSTLVDNAEGWFETLLKVCAFAGLRVGEAQGLQVGDIDFLGRTITVTRQVTRAPGVVVTTTPPKHGSERTIFAADDLLAAISAHIAEHGTVGPEGWLFRGSGHQPPLYDRILSMWKKTATAAKWSAFTLHSLRHFYASGLIAAGCDVVTVQRALGHSSPSITLNTYSHLWPSAEDRTRKAANAIMRETLKASADRLRTAPK